MTVFVLLYRHRHGEDISAYATEEAAIRRGAHIAMDYAHEVPLPEARRGLHELFSQDKVGEVVDLYNVSRDDEAIEIHGPMEVQS